MSPTEEIDLEALFSPDEPPPLYASDEEQIDAIGSGEKPVAYFELGDMRAVSAIRQTALDRGYLVVESPVAPRGSTLHSYYVLPAEESWRLTSHVTIMRIVCENDYDWSLALEHLSLLVLGLSEERINERLKTLRTTSAREAHATLYALVPESLLPDLDTMGMRAFSPESQLSTSVVFRPRKRVPIVATAQRDIGAATRMLRFAVTHAYADSTLPASNSSTVVSRAFPAIEPLNFALRSRIQVLFSDCWREAISEDDAL